MGDGDVLRRLSDESHSYSGWNWKVVALILLHVPKTTCYKISADGRNYVPSLTSRTRYFREI